MDKLTNNTQTEVSPHILFADDVVLINQTSEGVNQKLNYGEVQ